MKKNPVKKKPQPIRARLKELSGLLKNPPVAITAVCISLIIILVVVLSLLLSGIYSGIGTYSKTLNNLASSYASINKELDERTAHLSTAELLLDNTNRILSTVYFGTADIGEKEEAKDFTAFTMLYNKKFYLITAGHCIELGEEKYSNFKFKANNKSYWLHPKLLAFENDYKNKRDYAIFYSEHLFTMGLIPASGKEDLEPQYVLGNTERDLNLVKRYSDAIYGESGSPIINKKCHVVGVMITREGEFTPINTVLEALKKIEEKAK
jgi:hypothetical protein